MLHKTIFEKIKTRIEKLNASELKFWFFFLLFVLVITIIDFVYYIVIIGVMLNSGFSYWELAADLLTFAIISYFLTMLKQTLDKNLTPAKKNE